MKTSFGMVRQQLLVGKEFLIFGQWLIDRLWRPNERDYSYQVGRSQNHRRQAKAGHIPSTIKSFGQGAQNKQPEGGNVAANIIAEACASCAQAGRKQLWKINGV